METNNFKPVRKEPTHTSSPIAPTGAFIGASWIAFFIGVLTFCIGLWNTEMALHEQGYYLAVLILGLFATVSVQKNVRDRLEKLPVSDIYYGVSWIALFFSILLLIVGLWNADLSQNEKGFYGLSFVLSLFATVTVQKNVRDKQLLNREE